MSASDESRRFPGAIGYYTRIFRRFVGRRLYLVFGLTLLAVATEGLGIALILPLLMLLDAGAGSGAGEGEGISLGVGEDMSRLQDFLHGIVSLFGIQDSVPGILIFIGLVFVLKGGIRFAELAYMEHLSASLVRKTKAKLFHKYTSMGYGYYVQRNTGHFINVVTSQVRGMVNSFAKYVKFAVAVISVLVYFAFAFLISSTFAGLALIAGVVIMVLFRRLNLYVRRLSVLTASEAGRLNHLLVQTLQAFKYLVATAQMPPLEKKVGQSIRKLAGYQRSLGVAAAFTDAVKEPLAIILLVVIIVVQIGVLSEPLGPIFVALVLINRAMSKVVGVQANWQAMMSHAGSLESVQEEFANLEVNRESSGTTVLGPLRQGIEFDRVSFAYDPSEGDVLKGITLTIPVNQTVAFVGESGAGKSTLADLLTLMLRPDSGELTIDGVPHDEVALRSWRAQIGYVSQETVVFDDTVANNISVWRGDYEKDPEVRRGVREAAERACALEFIEALPRGFETRIGERGVRLSAGQRQRLFIARELYKNPSLLILDEATSALDSESEQVIKESVDQLQGSTTVVVIAHRLSTIRDVDRIYVLDQGRICEEGTYQELVARQGGLFQRSVALQNLGSGILSPQPVS